MIKGSIHIYVYTHQSTEPQNTQSKLTELEDRNGYITIDGKFSKLLLAMGRTSRQKINKEEMDNLNHTVNQLDLEQSTQPRKNAHSSQVYMEHSSG